MDGVGRPFRERSDVQEAHFFLTEKRKHGFVGKVHESVSNIEGIFTVDPDGFTPVEPEIRPDAETVRIEVLAIGPVVLKCVRSVNFDFTGVSGLPEGDPPENENGERQKD
jgi:hypothetical protein